jgi:antitoxin component YwqK of YwqJK toxin-antitoxin module
MSRFFRTAVLLSALFCPWVAHAVQSCEIDGQSVNPNNGNTTAGKTGLMRCRESDGGPVVREEELRNGVFIGVVRHFRGGVLEREHSVNEKGNREGRAREFAATPGATNQVLRDETLRNGTTIGVARTWLASGTLKRVSFHGDDGREQAVAEFTPQAKLADLRCGTQPLLAPEADDATWCGHRGKGPVAVELYSNNGAVRGRLTQERGERRKVETLWDSGKLRDKIDYLQHEGQSARRETRHHDNGRASTEGLRLVKGRYDDQATGTHKGFDDQGRLRSERFYDARGRVTRERELDEAGRVLQDEELFEDGSRKAFTR